MTHVEIAQQLQVSRASIGSDVQYLREQAKGTIKEYVIEHLPEQYQVCLYALDTILKHAFEILASTSSSKAFTLLFRLPWDIIYRPQRNFLEYL